MSCEQHEVHINGLQATLTKRNERIAELEKQLSSEGTSKRQARNIHKAYQKGWIACAGHLMETTRRTALELGKVRKDAFRLYLDGEKLGESE